ncbi:MAG TPA: lipopolysaccharide heptosyltransferase I [Acidobacteriaceae bacterium]|nr:lipopolysaccharide heptosyltransferase I [Acidobacteriaceae bacterium]
MKILIVRVGAMGDVLHALPAVAALRRVRQEWEIDWAVDPRWAALLVDSEGKGPVVGRVHLAETKLWKKAPASPATLRSVFELRRALRGESYDLAVDMQGTLRSAVIGRMAGAGQFAGYSDPREAMAAKFYKTKLERQGRHVIEQGAALLGEACGVALETSDVELPHEEWADHWAAEVVGDRQTCLLAAGAGWAAKCWAVEKYGELAVELKAMGMDVVVNASRKDDARAAAVVAASGGVARVVVCNVAGLTALMRRMTLLVGGDSGPTHLAAALGIPLVALFGPTDPERNGPRGPGAKVVLRDPASVTSYKRTNAEDAGLAKISVGTVVDAVRSLL